MKDTVINDKTGETRPVAEYSFNNKDKKVTFRPDAGWSSNVGKAKYLDDILAEKLEDVPKEIRTHFIKEIAEKQGKTIVEIEKTFKNIINYNALEKYNQNFEKYLEAEKKKDYSKLNKNGIQIGKINAVVATYLKSNNIDINNTALIIQSGRTTHSLITKNSAQKLTEKQFKKIPQMIADCDEIYLDKTKSNVFGLTFVKMLLEDEIVDGRDCIKFALN